MAIERLCRATGLAAAIVLKLVVCAARAGAADTAIDSKALADALVEVSGDEDTWFRSAGLLAFSLEIGVPEERFRETHPGAQLDKLPAPVLPALRQHVASINAWSGCFGDKRETQIVENDLFGGGSSKDAKKKTCEQVASLIVANLLPAKRLAGMGKDETENYELMAKEAAEWEKLLRGKPADERMKAWFDGTNDLQRRHFLALVIEMAHKPAYRLLEADFAKRAKAADVYLYLELSAYFRHRRAAGQKLYQQLVPVLRKQPFESGPPAEQQFFFDMWKLLTDYDTLEAAIADCQAGRLKLDELAELLNRSIDQPWAYHSMGLEPVSVFRPTMEQNLKALVAAAAREQDLTKRMALLELGLNATRLLNTVIGRTDEVERRPAPRSDSAEWRPMVEQLRELFKDDRVMFEGESLTTPGERAAGIVWELWKPEEQQYDAKTKTYSRDWRTDTLHSLARTARSLKIPAAEYFLTQPDGVEQETYPEQKAAAVAAKFVDGDAAAWRKQLANLPWSERLMLMAEAKRDKKLAFRMWKRLVEFVDWTGAAPNKPNSFAEVWRNMLAGEKLSAATWQALQDWIVAEARAGRYWTIVGETSPVRPGISLFVLPTSPQVRGDYAVPELHTGIRSDGIMLFPERERFRITSDKLEAIIKERNKELSARPTPIAAIVEQNAKQQGDEELCDEGFALRLIVLPPK